MDKHFLIGSIHPQRYFFSIAVCLGLVLAWLSRDSASLAFPELILMWQAQTLGPIATLIVVHICLFKFNAFNRVNQWMQLAISGLIGALIFSPIALMIDVSLGAEGFPDRLLDEWMDELIGLAPPVVFVWLAINAPWIMGFRISHAAKATDKTLLATEKEVQTREDMETPLNETPAKIPEQYYENDKNAKKAAFFRLLPNSIGVNLVYFQAELHYLKVVTDSGEALILYNIKDAAELFDDGYFVSSFLLGF